MVKVDIISGFLGAGKTTLIKRILREYSEEKVVIIENEFGDIGVDGERVKKDGIEVVELPQGCICCSMKTNFIQTLREVIEKIVPDRIIIEPTGLGLLSQILSILSMTEFTNKCTINSVVTIVDSIDFLDQLDVYGEFFKDQIKNASTIIMSKTQLVDDNKLNMSIEAIRELNNTAYIVTEKWNKLSSSQMISLIRNRPEFNIDDLFYEEYENDIMKGMDNFCIEINKEFTINRVNEILKRLNSNKYGEILRAKGLLKGRDYNIEFNYTRGHYTALESSIEGSYKFCVIGKNIDINKIKLLLFGEKFAMWRK